MRVNNSGTRAGVGEQAAGSSSQLCIPPVDATGVGAHQGPHDSWCALSSGGLLVTVLFAACFLGSSIGRFIPSLASLGLPMSVMYHTMCLS
jgi:hypothetical protein